MDVNDEKEGMIGIAVVVVRYSLFVVRCLLLVW